MSGRRARRTTGAGTATAATTTRATARSWVATAVLGVALLLAAGVVIAEATPAGAATAAGVAGASGSSGSTGAGRSAGSAETTGVSATVDASAVVGSDGRLLHAKVTGSVPEDGATLAQAPETVTLIVDKKPATVEGDPLRVYGPDGSRVDDGRTAVNAEGTRLTVALPTTNARPAGRYEVVYRLISADTHLIAGRLGFTTEAASPAGMAGLAQGGGPGQAGGGMFGLLHGWPDETYPPIVAGVGLALVALRLLWKRWRAEADLPPPLLPTMQGHLVDDQRDRRLDDRRAAPPPSYRPRTSPTAAPPPRRTTAHRASRPTHGRPR